VLGKVNSPLLKAGKIGFVFFKFVYVGFMLLVGTVFVSSFKI